MIKSAILVGARLKPEAVAEWGWIAQKFRESASQLSFCELVTLSTRAGGVLHTFTN